MTTKIKTYTTRNEMNTGNKRELNNSFRVLHVDYINNDQAKGFKVTYDNVPRLDPTPPPEREFTNDEIKRLRLLI